MGCDEGKGKGSYYEGKGKGKSKGSKSKGSKSKGKDGSKGKGNKGYYSKGKDSSKGSKGYYGKGYEGKGEEGKGYEGKGDADDYYDDERDQTQNEELGSVGIGEDLIRGNLTDDVTDVDISEDLNDNEALDDEVDNDQSEVQSEELLLEVRRLEGVRTDKRKGTSSSRKVFMPQASIFSLLTGIEEEEVSGFECTKEVFGCRDGRTKCERREGCGKDVPAGFYPDLTTPISYCYCPPQSDVNIARYESCEFGLVWDNHAFTRDEASSEATSVSYLPGVYGIHGLWGTNGGACVEGADLSREGHLVPTVPADSS